MTLATAGYNSIYRIEQNRIEQNRIIYSSYCNPNQRATELVGNVGFVRRKPNINDLYDYSAEVITGNLIAHLDIAGFFRFVFIHAC